jgi:hypothetical protein
VLLFKGIQELSDVTHHSDGKVCDMESELLKMSFDEAMSVSTKNTCNLRSFSKVPHVEIMTI